MNKTYNIVFYTVFSILLSLALLCVAHATEEPLTFSQFLSNQPKIYTERRTFQWENPQHFLESFNRGVKISFKGPLHGPAIFDENVGKEKILIVGGGLAYDDLVRGKPSLFVEPTREEYKDRIKYYPFNAYLVDLDGKHMYSENALSYSDLAINIRAPIGQFPGLPSVFINQFSTVVFEYIGGDLINPSVLTNIREILIPGGKLVFDSHIQLIPQDIAVLKSEGFESRSIEGIGTIYYKTNIPKTVSGFSLYCSTGDQERLEQHPKEVFAAFKGEVDERVRPLGFSSVDLTTSTDYWYSECCEGGYCIVYKNNK